MCGPRRPYLAHLARMTAWALAALLAFPLAWGDLPCAYARKAAPRDEAPKAKADSPQAEKTEKIG
ncbi:MAG: hypothetical protein Q8S17_11890, partial [Humidesulfovibrio sp.]|nr:hypothetical protein [Humidesulfovibrio sp.]